MPNRELLSYMDAANKLEQSNEPEKEGLSGEAAIVAMMNDPAIRKSDGYTR